MSRKARRKDRKVFTRTALRKNPKNLVRKPIRGGTCE